MSQQTSKLDTPAIFDRIKAWVEEGETNSSIVRKLYDFQIESSESAIRRFRKRHGINPSAFDTAYTEIDGDKAEAVTAPSPILDDPDTMLRQRGLDPEEWVIDSLRANEYQGPASAEHAEKTGENKITYYQTRFNVVRKKPLESQIVAPRTDGWIAPRAAGRDLYPEGDSLLCVVVGDQQAPFHDPDLHGAFLSWLDANRPDWGVSLGDSVDFPDISRHRLDPENTATVNECLQSGYDLFRDYVETSPDTWWRKLIGNHDERIRNILLDKPSVRPLYGLQLPSDEYNPSVDVLSLSHLMRLDELGIDVIDPKGAYDLAQIVLTPKLSVRHGWVTRKGSGASALGTLEHLGHSVIVGHTHRQAVVHDTKHEIDGNIRTLTGVEAGCMCRVSQLPDEKGRVWPNYAVAPDWQQGFCTVEMWDDGYFNIDTAKYVNGTLMWRGQRYE